MLTIRMIALGALALACAGAQAQATLRVRGTITSVDASSLAVKTRDGRELKLRLPENVTVAVAKAARFEDVKEGDYLGVTSVPGANGTSVAVELHYIAPTVAPGQTPSDLQPGSSMTNANVGNIVVATGRRELVLRYKDATQRIVVPDGIPIVRAVPGSRADLLPGEYIFAVAQVADDGTASAPRIQVSKDGVRPPQ